MVKVTNDAEVKVKSKKLKKEKKEKKEKKQNIDGFLEEIKNGEKTKKKDKKREKRKLENGHDGMIVKKLKTEKNRPASDAVTAGCEEAANSSADERRIFTHGVDADSQEAKGGLSNFRISAATVKKLNARGITYLFPVQESTFDYILDGLDVRAQARTGTGKTLAFALPLVEKLRECNDRTRGRPPKVLVLLPTRELAKQVGDEFVSISDNLSVLCMYGGTPYGPQEYAVRAGVDVLVGTPGRVLDLVEKGTLDVSKLQFAVLDEVDRMLDMGFKDAVESILQRAYEGDTADNPQTLLFSATMPGWVHDIAKKYMKRDTKFINLVGKDRVKTAVTVQHLALKCSYHDRAATLGHVLSVYSGSHGRAMVFCERKSDADELSMSPHIKQEAHVMHGDIPQEKRERVLQTFRDGKYRVLITTDVAARGLDIPEVDLVIQTAPPKDVDSYIHRSGRTGRAGRTGTCICFYKHGYEHDLKYVEKVAGITFKRIGAPSAAELIEAAANDAVKSLSVVPEETLSLFERSAEKLAEEYGAVRALSAALAVISGNTEIKERSLLTSNEGSTTYLFRTTAEIRHKTYVFNALRRKLPEEVVDKVRGCRLCADKQGAVFDLPIDFNATVEDHWSDGQYDTLTKATELPELEPDSQGYGGANRRSGYGGERRYGQGSDRRGGRGGSRGGFGGRGRGRGRGFQRNRYG